jgi:chorismate mutase/prephenate dehydrogenase
MEDLQTLRKRVNAVDEQIIKALSERVEICRQIGEVKKQQSLPIHDESRENEVYIRVREKAAKFKLEPARIEAVYREIVNMCSAVQE